MVPADSLESLKGQLDPFLAKVHAEIGVPGIAAEVTLAGERIFSSAGAVALDRPEPIGEDTEFRLGCIAKLLVAMAVLELAADRELDLDEPIQEYLPELRGTIHGRSVTLAHLLSHTAGYRGINARAALVRGMSWDQLIEYLREAPQHFPPGTVFSYEHTCAVLAGEAAARVTGRSGIAHAEERILQPLGIETSLLEAPVENRRQAGQHVVDGRARKFKQIQPSGFGTASDAPTIWNATHSKQSVSLHALTLLAELAMGTRRLGEAEGLAPETLEHLQRRVVTLPQTVSGPRAEVTPSAAGLGTFHWSHGFLGAVGGAYGQAQGLRFSAEMSATAVVGMNAAQNYLRDVILSRVCASLAGIAEPPEPSTSSIELRELEGLYHGLHDGRLHARLRDGNLVLVIESSTSSAALQVELAHDDHGRIALVSPVPSLSLGFFREAGNGNAGIRVGMTAYKRISPTAG